MRWIYLLFLIHCLHAGTILQTNDFGLIEKEVEQLEANSLVAVDVDDTLVTPKDALLQQRRREILKGLLPQQSGRNLFREICVKAPHTIVDERSVFLLQRLKGKQIPALALTAACPRVKRGDVPCNWRIDELKSYGFEFSSLFSKYDDFELLKESNALQTPMFKQGILFSAFHSKGLVLVRFLEAVNFVPTKVIFVDDDRKHVESVVAELEKQGIACLGIHYTAARDFNGPFDPEWAQVQINHFLLHDEWLSDGSINIL